MDSGLVVMSRREIERTHVMRAVQERRLTQKQAASQLALSVCQVERLFARYKRDGPTGFVSRRRRQRNHVLPDGLREEALSIVRTRYSDFGPTLAHEKLLELHGLRMLVETLRQWMIEDGMWKTRVQRRKRIQQPRHRRDCTGELVQIDGCEHHWFEDRAPLIGKTKVVSVRRNSTQRLIPRHSHPNGPSELRERRVVSRRRPPSNDAEKTRGLLPSSKVCACEAGGSFATCACCSCARW